MSNFISFVGGTIFGAFMSQNYDIIDIKDSYNKILVYINNLEKNDINNKNDKK